MRAKTQPPQAENRVTNRMPVPHKNQCSWMFHPQQTKKHQNKVKQEKQKQKQKQKPTYLFNPHDGIHNTREVLHGLNISRALHLDVQLNADPSIYRNSQFLQLNSLANPTKHKHQSNNTHRLDFKVRLMLFLLRLESFNSVQQLRVCLIEMRKRDVDGRIWNHYNLVISTIQGAYSKASGPDWQGPMYCNPMGTQLSQLPLWKHLLSSMVWLNTSSGGVYKSALMPFLTVGPRYFNGRMRHRSLSYTYTRSLPVTSRGGKKEPSLARMLLQGLFFQ